MSRYWKHGTVILLLTGLLSSCGLVESILPTTPLVQETIQPILPERVQSEQGEAMQPEPSAEQSETAMPEIVLPGQEASGNVEKEPLQYSFLEPAPETEPVDNTYFEDAVFIGDSRTDGFLLYSGIGCGDNLTSNGLSIFALESKKVFRVGSEKYTLRDALEQKQYGKVYLSLGVNELGYYDDQGFYEGYLSAIDLIRETQPNAVIYIQGLIPVNEQLATADFLKNDHLRIYNDLMFQAAQEKRVVFLDLYTEFADEQGGLPEDASKDGVHLYKPYCEKWLAYLQRHTVEAELFFAEANEEITP